MEKKSQLLHPWLLKLDFSMNQGRDPKNYIDHNVVLLRVLYCFIVYVTSLWIPELEICQVSPIFANIYFSWGQKNIQMRIISKIMFEDLGVIIMHPLTKISLDTT